MSNHNPCLHRKKCLPIKKVWLMLFEEIIDSYLENHMKLTN